MCKRLPIQGHEETCPWQAMEKRVKELEARCDTLMRLVQGLDERTIGSMRF
ncbi:MAG TPA: hypothetical protein VGK73_30625 [Polyangiaceae bacterium]